jgi:hypothetical protein
MMMKWTRLDELNEWTGEVRTRYIAEVTTSDRVGRAYLQVHEVDGRWYWSANMVVAHKPKMTRMAYGTYAVTPYSLSVAKMTAMRHALKTIRAVEPFIRAA